MKKIVFFIICCLIFVSCGEGLNSPQSDYITVVVNSVNQQQNVLTSVDGKNTTSETVLMVYTDNGTFEIDQEGIFAHPSLFGRVHQGDTIDIKYAMYDAPIIGQYRVITDIR